MNKYLTKRCDYHKLDKEKEELSDVIISDVEIRQEYNRDCHELKKIFTEQKN